jgi:CDGSH-type Zn-finger protein/uncharacterized Fe-S cluster protein YjdI
MSLVEPEITVRSREDLLYLLAEASEIEHNLMCCYLYAAFSLKQRTDEGLTQDDVALIARWRSAIMSVAIEEMTHLTLVSNLTAAMGRRPHLSRPNFPISPGAHPADVVVRLAPFTMDTLDHFIFLERPEGSEIQDSPAFAHEHRYARVMPQRRVMPSSQDYATVGHLYRGIRDGLDRVAMEIGEEALFCGAAAHQVGPSVVALPGLCVVTDLKSAHTAIDTIVDQGEGAEDHNENSHFSRFVQIKREYQARLLADPGFTPGRPAATNPVMRRPPDPAGRVYIDAPKAAAVVDFANALYGQMLRFLMQAFGRTQPQDEEKAILIDAAIEIMQHMVPAANALTEMQASPSIPGVNAGVTFATLRNFSPAIEGPAEWIALGLRTQELATAARDLVREVPALNEIADRLHALAEKLKARAETPPVPAVPLPKKDATMTETPTPVSAVGPKDGIEIAQGKEITIRFNTKRCIHGRFCVLSQPQVYKANVVGPWIDPDADSVEATVAVAQNCPSGAISYDRHDGGPAEPAPRVNIVNVRENGPLAIRAQIQLNGKPIGMRATLCRCGASKNKPFCDFSHVEAGFQASGEPPKIETEALAVRYGVLDIAPQPNGPLRVRGNMEICSGTNRTIKRSTGEMLCRCGHSQNKPFCDGSHVKAGFVAGA